MREGANAEAVAGILFLQRDRQTTNFLADECLKVCFISKTNGASNTIRKEATEKEEVVVKIVQNFNIFLKMIPFDNNII